ncbi:NUDIX hydrolase [Porphyrobacter sp. ULC335]|uniref:NUDIX hydrolase n=1 Tax=Porphyrobacter sp. ULC335 TaxID=2854260 RepID=UPI00221F7165|nr:NUDIX hydrolase [Porphyrobacter sp. ULC335]UYV16877.1 NUDIX hydrolase [Porphyrobacter sp. ULC335]
MIDDRPFSGAKIVLYSGSHLIAYLRDDKPNIPFPGLWDLPGGGRELDETPAQCAVREVEEEFGLTIAIDRIVLNRRYESRTRGGRCSFFLAAPLQAAEIGQIVFGEEGQRWRMMSFDEFLGEENAVPDLQARLKECLPELK